MSSIPHGIAALLVVKLLLFTVRVRAANPPEFTDEQLDQMLAPIALFTDALVSQVLMASAYPQDVVQPADWAFANRSLKADEAAKSVQDTP